ncbi:hypothetical protein E3T61_19685 [Cryobacterium lactosi]|uniref:Glycoside hydrolase family 20 catalytic domain-containing protein n=1 Tax=Cryobacterium lactosi TaxID=1259202 RepID=A0A4R9BGJ1_9MICO|nr:family 20 glycosylhydrolase [Cryobacterium lactosi]TFD84000.1 hypothetical protein E3T61_19685 [Cryobacterium lactosi]
MESYADRAPHLSNSSPNPCPLSGAKARATLSGPSISVRAATSTLERCYQVCGPAVPPKGSSPTRLSFSVQLVLHLTDDQGWHLHIDSWPELTGIGASTSVDGVSGGFY